MGTIILSILVLTVIGGSLIYLNQSTGTSIKNIVTEQGTKLELVNNNSQDWESVVMEVPNTTSSNGNKKNYFVVAWIEPGSNVTLDLSNMLGYGNKTLPSGTVVNILSGSSLYNTVPDNGDFSLEMVGWSYTPTAVNASTYNITKSSLSVATLPSNIKNDTVMMGYNQSDIMIGQSSQIIYTEMKLTVNQYGNIIITYTKPPTLYQPMQTSM